MGWGYRVGRPFMHSLPTCLPSIWRLLFSFLHWAALKQPIKIMRAELKAKIFPWNNMFYVPPHESALMLILRLWTKKLEDESIHSSKYLRSMPRWLDTALCCWKKRPHFETVKTALGWASNVNVTRPNAENRWAGTTFASQTQGHFNVNAKMAAS